MFLFEHDTHEMINILQQNSQLHLHKYTIATSTSWLESVEFDIFHLASDTIIL